MCNKGFFKRIVPFFLTFAVGLFIASFFVTVAAPSFQFNNRARRHREYHRTMEFENQRLREENFRLRRELSDKEDSSNLSSYGYGLEVPPPPMPPMPPPVPVRNNHR
ncbi:MAG TPA: hypothetical protein VNI84_05040 [Pyrinomonadaceae bacterium]|nr:hypothetical protein [Pyrinomonadaceae bacterium]